MDYLQNHIQCSPFFPANSDTFTFDSANMTNQNRKRNTLSSLTSPFSLVKRASETFKDNQSNFTLQSPEGGGGIGGSGINTGQEFTLISFKENKSSPFSIHNNPIGDSSPQFQLENFNITNSSENGSSSRNNNNGNGNSNGNGTGTGLLAQMNDMKDNTYSLPKSRYSSKYINDQTIEEDPNEDSFNHRRHKGLGLDYINSNEYTSRRMKDNSSNESKRMIIELLKILDSNDDLITQYRIDIGTFIPYHFLRATFGANGNGHIKRKNCKTHISTVKSIEPLRLFSVNNKDNDSNDGKEEKMDEATRLICFLAIPRVVYLYHSKQLMCISPCPLNHNTNEELYSITFRHIDTMKVIEVISLKSITDCDKRSDVVFSLKFIQAKTYLKKVYNIETESKEDCENYMAGINALLNRSL